MKVQRTQRGPTWDRMKWLSLAGVLTLSLAGGPVLAASEAGAEAASDTEERLDVLEEQVKTLASEISKAVTEAAVPEDGNWENYYGTGPAAAKVYRKDAGLSIGGYGEVLF
ncbi:MAG: hypothetical protein VCC04_00535, partial [Myxococcota bacterium]